MHDLHGLGTGLGCRCRHRAPGLVVYECGHLVLALDRAQEDDGRQRARAHAGLPVRQGLHMWGRCSQLWACLWSSPDPLPLLTCDPRFQLPVPVSARACTCGDVGSRLLGPPGDLACSQVSSVPGPPPKCVFSRESQRPVRPCLHVWGRNSQLWACLVAAVQAAAAMRARCRLRVNRGTHIQLQPQAARWLPCTAPGADVRSQHQVCLPGSQAAGVRACLPSGRGTGTLCSP